MATYTREVERQRDAFGGINWGAGFFGWLVAVGVGALLTALIAAAGTAIAIGEVSASEAAGAAEEIGLGGAIALFVIGAIAYFAGGYVAGRMSRFDGARQGAAAWIWGIVAVVVLAVVGAIAGSEYNVFAQLNLPRIPIEEGELASGGVIALVAIIAGTLVAAILGGKAGEAYHRRVDAAGYPPDADRPRTDVTREQRARDEETARAEREPWWRRGPLRRPLGHH